MKPSKGSGELTLKLQYRRHPYFCETASLLYAYYKIMHVMDGVSDKTACKRALEKISVTFDMVCRKEYREERRTSMDDVLEETFDKISEALGSPITPQNVAKPEGFKVVLDDLAHQKRLLGINEAKIPRSPTSKIAIVFHDAKLRHPETGAKIEVSIDSEATPDMILVRLLLLSEEERADFGIPPFNISQNPRLYTHLPTANLAQLEPLGYEKTLRELIFNKTKELHFVMDRLQSDLFPDEHCVLDKRVIVGAFRTWCTDNGYKNLRFFKNGSEVFVLLRKGGSGTLHSLSIEELPSKCRVASGHASTTAVLPSNSNTSFDVPISTPTDSKPKWTFLSLFRCLC